jgi:hypothetical protein
MKRSKNATAKILILLAFSIIAFPVFSGEHAMTYHDALDLLKETSRIESRLIGEEGKKSLVFCAYSILESNENPGALFRELYKGTSSNPAKVYALIWFFEHDKNTYEKYKNLLKKGELVNVMIGDIVFQFTMGEIFQKIESNELNTWLKMGETGNNCPMQVVPVDRTTHSIHSTQ